MFNFFTHLQLMSPSGNIGVQEKSLILISLGLMLLVVVPVIFLTLYFAWRYRAGSATANAAYAPKWHHSTAIEVVIWTIPCVIVILLGVMIWTSTHSLDPYQPLKSEQKPVRVEVVALNWKWLFIYPDYGVASVNELRIPTGTPIAFSLTAESLMNSFFIPRLGSQVYAMSGMQTQLHLIADQPGVFEGMSSAFSGEGFSGMRFQTVATGRAEFERWIVKAKQAPQALDQAHYLQLEQASEQHPVTVYRDASPGLFQRVVNKYMTGPNLDELCRVPAAPVVSIIQPAE